MMILMVVIVAKVSWSSPLDISVFDSPRLAKKAPEKGRGRCPSHAVAQDAIKCSVWGHSVVVLCVLYGQDNTLSLVTCNAWRWHWLPLPTMANLRTKILDFRGFDSSRILTLRGRITRPIGNFPGKIESRNLSRDNISREIGRIRTVVNYNIT